MNATSSTPSRWTLIIGIAALAAGLIAGPVLAGALAPNGRAVTPLTATGDTTPEHTISVTGAGKITVVPDMAIVNLGVYVEKNTAKAAREAAAVSMTKVIAALRALGIADKDIATAMISLNPVYDYSTNVQQLRGYQLSNQVTVTVRDLAKVSDVLDDSIAAGANTVNGVSFDVADRSGAEAKARTAAVVDAKAKADALAAGVGVHVTGVASISETVSSPIWYNPQMATGGVKQDAATPVMPGTTDIEITVQVSFLID
ncbi:MAG: SIMPL domain-containing protein [Chloroflexota bacterium]